MYLAPDGNTRRQVQKMVDSAISWADGMRTGKISKEDAWLSFQSTIWKSLTYPLPAVNISKEACKRIMAPVLHYLLPAIGVCRNFPRKLVYAPEKYMGLGIRNLYTVQETMRATDILSQVFRRSTSGRLYRSSLELLLIELGMGSELHLIPGEMLDNLTTDSLVKSTCQYLRQIKY